MNEVDYQKKYKKSLKELVEMIKEPFKTEASLGASQMMAQSTIEF